jgi:DNA-binding beta-propeller fold protein YncE
MNFRLQVLDQEGEVISVFGEAGDASGYLARPKGIATDSFGNIYSVDALFHVVQVFDAKGNYLYKFGSQGHGNSEFWMPAGIFIDASDMIYVADTYNSRIQVFKLIYTDSK